MARHLSRDVIASFDPTKPYSIQEADALNRPSAVQLLPASEPTELIAFYGGDHFGLIASVAADFEAQGRKPFLMWKRDQNGLIDGIAIVERAR